MTTLLICLLVAVGIAVLWLLCLNGRHGNPTLSSLRGAVFAHRGLHGAAAPENSLAAFRAAVEHGYGAELDVHLTKDGVPVAVHDTVQTRLSGDERRIDDLTRTEAKTLRLGGTDETIPTLEEVLAVFDGKTPLLVELKPDRGNAAALCQAAMALLDSYQGLYAVQSFDPRCLLWLKAHRPSVVRGQLAQNFHRSKEVNLPLRFLLTSLILNVLTRPDYISYRFAHRRHLAFVLCSRVWKMPCAYWTLCDKAAFDAAVRSDAMPIFEGFLPEE